MCESPRAWPLIYFVELTAVLERTMGRDDEQQAAI